MPTYDYWSKIGDYSLKLVELGEIKYKLVESLNCAKVLKSPENHLTINYNKKGLINSVVYAWFGTKKNNKLYYVYSYVYSLEST